MDDIPPGKGRSMKLERGRPLQINPNRPVKFRIRLPRGGFIHGVVPPNSPLTVCIEGDDEIVGFDVVVDEDSTKPIQAVED